MKRYVAATVRHGEEAWLEGEVGNVPDGLNDVFGNGEQVVIISRHDFDTLSDIFEEQMK